jgi:hypothetical protein
MSRPTSSPPTKDTVSDLLLPLEDLRVRIFVLLGGFGLIALLATARWLTPDARGLGTHEQLGLPPCGFYLWYGLPCPSCGMQHRPMHPAQILAWIILYCPSDAPRAYSHHPSCGTQHRPMHTALMLAWIILHCPSNALWAYSHHSSCGTILRVW